MLNFFKNSSLFLKQKIVFKSHNQTSSKILKIIFNYFNEQILFEKLNIKNYVFTLCSMNLFQTCERF